MLARLGVGSSPAATKGPAEPLDVESTLATMEPVEALSSLVEKAPVLVLSKSWCGFCARAKRVLSMYEIPADKLAVIELDVVPQGPSLQAAAARLTGRRTVPNVWVGGANLGGADDIVRLH